ncbi:MAG: phospholipid carrier-dependent glycosyltransferase [Anaerolineae bacterium]|nr:phospholipid carrier-dependent glycosyltransferase [Anaerolineae bacterium]
MMANVKFMKEVNRQEVSEHKTEVLNKSICLIFVLIGFLILALGLRIWGIGFGLPYRYHIDEQAYISAALNLGVGIIDHQPNPTGFSNILFVEYCTYFILGWLAGLFPTIADFKQAYQSDPSTFILLGRITSVTFGVLNVLIVYWFGWEIRNQLVGLLASLFLAMAFLHVRDSHYAVPDVAVTFFVTFSVLMCVRAVQRRNWWNLYIAAALGGFAIAVKWSVLLIIIPLAIGFVYGGFLRYDLYKRNGRFNPSAFTILFPLFGGFFIGGFQLFLRPTAFIAYALHEAQAGTAGGFFVWQVDTVSGWVFYLKTLCYGLGGMLLVLGAIGAMSYILISSKGKDRMSLLILAFPLSYYLLMGATRHYFARYALPLVPFFALFAAEVIVFLLAWIRTKWVRLAQVLAPGLVLIVIIQPLVSSIRHDIILTRQDTRTQAKRWIEANLPPGTRIAVDWGVHGPPLSMPGWAIPYSDKVYDVMIINGTGLSDHSIAWYREQDFDYLITSSFIYNIPLVYKDQDTERRTFYASLGDEFALVKEFHPGENGTDPSFIFDEIYGPAISLWQRERPGPSLKIYQVNP